MFMPRELISEVVHASKHGLFLKAEFRPRNRNTKSEPRLSGLTFCVPILWPHFGLIYRTAVEGNMIPANGTTIRLIVGFKNKAGNVCEDK